MIDALGLSQVILVTISCLMERLQLAESVHETSCACQLRGIDRVSERVRGSRGRAHLEHSQSPERQVCALKPAGATAGAPM